MPNGKDYILFYLKMLLESIDHEGELRFSETIPYNEQMLSVITNTNVDIVRSALKVFTELNMMEILEDSTIYMREVEKLTGCETSVAARVRKHRETKKALQCNTLPLQSYTEIEKEKELKKELEIEEEEQSAPPAEAPPARPAKSTIDYESFQNTYNEICTNLSKVKLLSDKRKTAIRKFLKQLTFEDFQKACEIANTLDFTTGNNSRGWKADFDFLITVDKALGVLEGKYKDKEPKRTEPPKERSYDVDEFFDLACKRGAGTPKTAGNDESIRERAEALKKQLS
jgi:predicted phage replisome organizer